jgi:hypothetical protein
MVCPDFYQDCPGKESSLIAAGHALGNEPIGHELQRTCDNITSTFPLKSRDARQWHAQLGRLANSLEIRTYRQCSWNPGSAVGEKTP